MLYISLIAILGIALLVLVINLPVHVAIKFGLGVAAMYGISKLLAKKMKMKDEWGMLLLRSRAGLKTIGKLAEMEGFWKLFADVGTVLAYGALSFLIIRRPLGERALVLFLGLILLSVISFAVAPFVFPYLLGLLGTEGLASRGAAGADMALVAAGSLYIGGFALMVLVSLLGYASVILSALASALILGTTALKETAPGATFILPGLNIPFAEGVIALAAILAVHEGAHAVLTRIAKIRILSSGVVLFGVIPIGAFVEPDEKALAKLDREKQTRVLVAGSTANLFASAAAFFVFLAFVFAAAPYKESGLLVVSGNASGSVIYRINGQDASEFLASADNETKYGKTLVFEGSRGTYEAKIQKGELKYYDLSATFFLAKYSNPALEFIYNVLGLVFSLNFVIGVVNLLPLPFFDGYRLLELNVDRKALVTAVSWITAAAFLVNFLPWLF